MANNIKDKKNYTTIILVVIIAILLLVIYNDKKEEGQYTGYCRIEGSYRNRFVKCYGDYSPSAKERAEEHANYCNVTATPVSGCTSTYR